MSVSELPRSGPAGARRPASSRRTTAAGRLPDSTGPAEVIALPLPRRAPAYRTRARARYRWPAYVLMGGGVLLLPWLVLLAVTLPTQTLAWVGLDAMEAGGLIVTGLLVLRRHPLRAATAAMTATLLLVDAWFDITTSTGSDLAVAVILAVLAELPLAALCATVAVSAAITPAPPSPPPTCPTASAAARRKG
jgi:hypothetical protein